MSQYCKSCHHENLDVAIYCANCGNTLKIERYKEKNIDKKLISQIKMWTILTVVFIVLGLLLFSKLIFETENKKKYSNLTEEVLITETKRISNKNLQKDSFKCNIEWIIDNGNKIKPTNENLQIINIQLIDKMDKLHLKTQNTKSTYNYYSFIDLKNGNLGMDYTLGNRFIDIFQDGTLFLGDTNNGIDTKYYCKDMILDIKKISPQKIDESKSMSVKKIEEKQKTVSDKEFKSIQKFLLKINMIPSNAKVRILNIKPKYHNGIKLKKGKYHIEVSKKGYRTIDKWITLKQNENFNFELKKIKKDISPKVIKDEHVISHGSYASPKVIKHDEPINNYSVPKKISKKERENLNTCLKGYLTNSCKHSWLTPQQSQEVKRAERRENLNTCLKGYLINSCKHSWLTTQQANEVRIAENREGN